MKIVMKLYLFLFGLLFGIQTPKQAQLVIGFVVQDIQKIVDKLDSSMATLEREQVSNAKEIVRLQTENAQYSIEIGKADRMKEKFKYIIE